MWSFACCDCNMLLQHSMSCTYMQCVGTHPYLPRRRLFACACTLPSPPHLPSLPTQSVSYVSRRRMDDADFDPNAVDEDGLPMVYNESKIAQFWSKRPGELVGRWTRFTAISGEGTGWEQARHSSC